MSKIRVTNVYNYPHERGPRSYSLRPDMGVVDHFPERVCAAAVKAGCAEYVDKKKPHTRGTAKPAK